MHGDWEVGRLDWSKSAGGEQSERVNYDVTSATMLSNRKGSTRVNRGLISAWDGKQGTDSVSVLPRCHVVSPPVMLLGV